MYKESKSTLPTYTAYLRPSEQFHLSRNIARRNKLKGILTELRDQEIQTMKELVRNEFGTGKRQPRAETAQACHRVNLEFDLSFISLSESRLAAIWDAFDRLEQGLYGLCEQCGNAISIGQLRALPMVRNCSGCAKDGPTFDV